jgi:predicted ester cyclase
MASAEMENKAIARRALEQICSGNELESAGQCYHEAFEDHVNSIDFQGMEGIQQSVSLYRQMFSDLVITVDDQVADGDQVASRWTMEGTRDGRRVSLSGVTISRFAEGRIREDWTHFDSTELVRQLEEAPA